VDECAVLTLEVEENGRHHQPCNVTVLGIQRAVNPINGVSTVQLKRVEARQLGVDARHRSLRSRQCQED